MIRRILLSLALLIPVSLHAAISGTARGSVSSGVYWGTETGSAVYGIYYGPLRMHKSDTCKGAVAPRGTPGP